MPYLTSKHIPMSFITDLITLDVVTVTGDLRVKTKNTANGERNDYLIDFKSLFGRKDGKTTVRGDLKVVAATHIEIDKDTLTFISDDLNDIERELVDVHMDTVATALESRAAIVARLLPGRLGGKADGRLGDDTTS